MTEKVQLRKNVAANMAGTAVAAATAVLSAPLLYRWLGADAYGLVGVYVLLQTLMPLFDAGITAGLARAVAWHRGRSLGEVRTLVSAAEWPVTAMAIAFFVVALFGTDFVARKWFAGSALPLETIRATLWCMGGALALRLVAGLGRATLMALELQAHANGIQAAAAVARTFGALMFALVTEAGIFGFFAAQVPISLAEWLAYRVALRRKLAQAAQSVTREELRRHLKFAFGIAGLSAAWLLTSQIDKVLLAERLTLSGYGAYSLGVHIASTLLLAVGAVHGAVLPRMTHQFSVGEEVQTRTLYGFTTTFTVAISCAVLVAIATGGDVLVPSLRKPVDGIDPLHIAWLYGAGNAGAALLAMAYQLQNARGVLRIHALGTALQAAFQVPLMVWAAMSGDAVRTAIVFAAVNWTFVIAWLPVVHCRFLPGGHRRWLVRHLLPSLIAGAVVGTIAVHAVRIVPNRLLWEMASVVLAAGVTFLATMLSDRVTRRALCVWRSAHVE